jgi:hypothetical protein
MCVKLVIYKNYTKMHGQQNIKVCSHVTHYGGNEMKVHSIVIKLSLCNNN